MSSGVRDLESRTSLTPLSRKPVRKVITRALAIPAGTLPVKVTMVFQKGLRHTCRYDTGIIPFDMTLTTSFVDNRLLTEGELYIDYTTELAGSSKAITRLRMRIWDVAEEE